MTDIANVAQREYWNTVAGPKWIALGAGMESRLARINHLILEAARPRPGERVLDVGCGMGPTTLPVASAVGAEGHVLGIDIAEPMLAAARERVRESGLRNVVLELADAQAHSFEPGAFDLVVSRFGVMFFEDAIGAFANLLTAMRLGGRLCFVCWDAIADNPHWRLPLDVAIRHLGPPSPKPPRSPGPLAFSDPSYVNYILTRAGFAAVSVNKTKCALVGASIEREVDFACVMGPPGALIAERQPDPSTLALIRQEIAAAIAPYATETGVVLPAGLLLVEATRP